MKRFILFLSAICICTFAIADTVNITWKNGDTTYDTTTCTVGGNLNVPATPPTKTGYNFVGWRIKAAKELEYIGFTGSQYIDTGIKFDSDEIEYETKVKFSINTLECIFGAADDQSYGLTNDSGSIRMDNNQLKPFFHIASMNTNRSLRGTIEANSVNTYRLYVKKSTGVYKGTINDTVLEGTWTGSIVSNKNIWIGRTNISTTTKGTTFLGDMYYFRIKKDGVLVLDLIPAKDPDGIVCFYDRISKTFFYNQAGISLVAGPEVE